jgi:formylglycine-generating enzyme required for sulfatase activity
VIMISARLVLLVALLAQASPPPAGSEDKAKAKVLLQEGLAANRQGQHGHALEKFQAAYAAYPSPKLWFNIGQVELALDHPVEAIQAFEIFQALVPGAQPDEKKIARTSVEQLRKKLGQLEVKCETTGADIAVDGKSVGRVPLAGPLWSTPGNHRVTITHEGSVPASETVDLRAGASALVVMRLVPLPPPAPLPPAPPAPAVLSQARRCAPNQIVIPGGTFNMGSLDGDSDERPVHKVILSPYCIDKTEVTVEAYRTCIEGGVCNAPRMGGHCSWKKYGEDQKPINCVDWNQAERYCEWTGGRLPTEAEWEFAARGSDGRKFPWGGSPPAAQLCWNGRGNDWGKDERQGTCAVGSYLAGASPFGVLDMAGNVWEWTADINAPYPATQQRNLLGVPTDTVPNRVIRGGGWSDVDPFRMRAANRYGNGPGIHSDNLGFRCIRGPQR